MVSAILAGMDDQLYDEIGVDYERAKFIPSEQASRATVLAALPDLTGLRALDVGCGTGFYPTLFAELGAGEVLGIDISTESVAVAAASAPAGVRYERGDALALPVLGEFDLVVSIWVVPFAETVEQLDAMMAGIRRNVRPGGVALVLGPNPDLDPEFAADGHRKYGYVVSYDELIGDRAVGTARLTDGGPEFAFPTARWSPVIPGSLTRAGFTHVRHEPVALPDHPSFVRRERDLPVDPDPAYWTDLLRAPLFALYIARVE